MFILEGNIGAGKSTLLELLQKKYNINISFEPVQDWTGYTDNNNMSIFGLFYTNPEKYAFAFQMYILSTRLKQSNNITSPDTLCERSILTDKYIFMNTLRESKLVSSIEEKVFNEWFEMVSSQVIPRIKGVVYLNVDPSICYQRIKIRNRRFEENMSIEYITQLHTAHQDAFVTNPICDNVLIVNDINDESLRDIYLFITCNT